MLTASSMSFVSAESMVNTASPRRSSLPCSSCSEMPAAARALASSFAFVEKCVSMSASYNMAFAQARALCALPNRMATPARCASWVPPRSSSSTATFSPSRAPPSSPFFSTRHRAGHTSGRNTSLPSRRSTVPAKRFCSFVTASTSPSAEPSFCGWPNRLTSTSSARPWAPRRKRPGINTSGPPDAGRAKPNPRASFTSVQGTACCACSVHRHTRPRGTAPCSFHTAGASAFATFLSLPRRAFSAALVQGCCSSWRSIFVLMLIASSFLAAGGTRCKKARSAGVSGDTPHASGPYMQKLILPVR